MGTPPGRQRFVTPGASATEVVVDVAPAGVAEPLVAAQVGDEQIDHLAELLLVAIGQRAAAATSVAGEHWAECLHGGCLSRGPPLHEHEGELS